MEEGEKLGFGKTTCKANTALMLFEKEQSI